MVWRATIGGKLLQTSLERIAALSGRRGVKRRCQGDDCGTPFYDLNRTPIACPNCGSAYVPPTEITLKKSDYGKRPVYKLIKQPDEVVEPANAGDGAVDADELELEADDTDTDKVENLLEVDDEDASADEIVDTSIAKDETV